MYCTDETSGNLATVDALNLAPAEHIFKKIHSVIPPAPILILINAGVRWCKLEGRRNSFSLRDEDFFVPEDDKLTSILRWGDGGTCSSSCWGGARLRASTDSELHVYVTMLIVKPYIAGVACTLTRIDSKLRVPVTMLIAIPYIVGVTCTLERISE